MNEEQSSEKPVKARTRKSNGRSGEAVEAKSERATLDDLREELRGLRAQLVELAAVAAAYGASAAASRAQSAASMADIAANLAKLETLGQAQARALALMQRAVAMQLEIDAARMQAEQGGNDGQ